MSTSYFLQEYLEQRLSEHRVEVSPKVSLEHSIWDGRQALSALGDQLLGVVQAQVAQADLDLVQRVLGVIGELSGQELSCAHLAHSMGLSPKLALRLLGAMENAGLWRHVKCFDRENILVDDKSKGYLLNTGILCETLDILDPVLVREHRAWGAIFETFIVQRVASLLPPDARLFYWRTVHGRAEVDIVLTYRGVLYPIEVKSAQHVSLSNARKIEIFTRYYEKTHEVAPGLVVYTGAHYYPLNEGIFAVPWSLI